MPVYQYECETCNSQYEIKQKFSDDPLAACLTPECQGTPQRVINPVGIVFKGSGFYINDSKNKKSNGLSSAKSEDSSKKPEKKAESDTKSSTDTASEKKSSTAANTSKEKA